MGGWDYNRDHVVILRKHKIVTCNNCGEGKLHWQQVESKWRLHNEKGELHNCSYEPDIDPFNQGKEEMPYFIKKAIKKAGK